MTSPTIERLAQTVCLSLNFEPADDMRAGEQTFYRWEAYVPVVVDLLTALRNPSEGMKKAGALPVATDQFDTIYAEDAEFIWQNMLDHLINEARTPTTGGD